MQHTNRALRALSMVTGLTLVGVAAWLNMHHVVEVEGKWLSPFVVSIGVLAVGSAVAVAVIQAAWCGGHRGLAVFACVGMIAGEAFGLQTSAERLLAARYARVHANIAAAQPWTQADQALKEATAAAQAECATGRGPKCKAAETRQDAKRAALVATKPPVVSSNLAGLTGINGDLVEIVPALAFSLGLLTLGFVCIAFGHASGGRMPERQSPRATQETSRPPVGITELEAPITDDEIEDLKRIYGPPQGGPKLPAPTGRTYSRREAELDLVSLMAFSGSVPEQGHLASRWGVHKSTVSRWCDRWEQDGLINRHQIGKAKSLRAVVTA